MSRTKIRQVVQVANSETYNDAYADAHTAGGAQPSHPDLNIEHDLNVLRTNLKDLKGTGDWYTGISAGADMTEMAADIDDLESALGSGGASTLTTPFGDTNAQDILGNGDTLANRYTGDGSVVESLNQIDTDLDTLEAFQTAAQTFTGMDNGTDSTPDYSSTVVITQNASLETTIGELDAYLGTIDLRTTLQDAFDNSQTDGESSPEIAFTDKGLNFVGTSSEFDVDTASGAISLDAGAASNFSTSAGGMTIGATDGGVLIDSDGEASKIHLDSEGTGTDAVDIDSAGGVDIDAVGIAAFNGASVTIGATSTSTSITANTSATMSGASASVNAAAGPLTLGASSTLFVQASDIDADADNSFDAYAGTTAALTGNTGATITANTNDLVLRADDGYTIFDDQFTDAGNFGTHSGVALSSGADAWDATIVTEDGRANAEIGILDAINAVATIAEAGNSLQEVYDETAGVDPDILVANDDELNFRLGNAGSSFKVSSDGNDQILEVTDGYVKVDGYFLVTGSSFTVDSTIIDHDHLTLHPALAGTTALTLEPKVSQAAYTANLMEVYDGYQSIDGALVMSLDDNGDAYFAKTMDVDGTSDFEGAMNLQAGITVAGTADLDGGAEVDTSFTYTVAPSVGHFLKTDAAGLGTWTQIDGYDIDLVDNFDNSSNTTVQEVMYDLDQAITTNASSISTLDVSAGAGLAETGSLQAGTLDFSVNVVSGETIIDGDAVGIDEAFSKSDFTTFTADSTGGFDLNATSSSAITLDASATSNFTTSVGDLTLAAAAQLDLDGATVTMDSTGDTTITAGTTMNLDSSSGMSIDGGATSNFSTSSGDIDISAAAELDLDGATIVMDSAGTMSIDAAGATNLSTSTGDLTLEAGSDGYLAFDQQFTGDAYYLSTGATGWSSAIEAIDGRTGNNIGIIDAINAAASAGGGNAEKAIYIIGAADARLFDTGALTDNALDLDASGGPDRGSIDLDTVSGSHKTARDVEVSVNGVLQLPDASQGVASGSATDDYYVASDDATRIVFAYQLVEGDVVTVINRTPLAGEDVDTGWTY